MTTGPFEDLTKVVRSRDNFRSAESAIPFWGDVPEAWDTLVIAGIVMPGLVRVRGNVGQRWDQRTTPGKNGIRLTTLGYDAAPISITLRMWMPDHLRDFEQLVRRIRPRFRGFRGKFLPEDAITLEHPAVALYDITAVVVTKLGFPEPQDKDIYDVNIECIEYIGQDLYKDSKDYGMGSGVKTTKHVGRPLTDLGKGKLGEKVDAAIKASKPSQTNTGPVPPKAP